MDSRLDYVEPLTPAICFESLNKNEDSGYHTFTPSSLESEVSSDFPDASNIINKKSITTCCHSQTNRKLSWPKTPNVFCAETPPIKRGVKRLYQDTETVSPAYNTVPTPTSAIAGKIKTLDVNENKENASYFMSPLCSKHDGVPRELQGLVEYEFTLSYPTTPVKNNCKVNPCRRTPKKLNFIHSLSCEAQELQTVKKHTPIELTRTFFFRPEQKIDIVYFLNQNVCLPAIGKIFNYLSNEDIKNFKLVSKTWNNIWDTQTTKRKQEFLKHLKSAKENRENRDKGFSFRVKISKQARLLNEIQNVFNENIINNISRSPPSTPRTNRFKNFAKKALLDTRIQLSCCRCQQPAKVTEESSGEVWAECTSLSCSYQFCKYCRCGRHPSTTCLQYDLEGPSPSKRKKSQYSIGTKKSRKSLRRLIDMSC